MDRDQQKEHKDNNKKSPMRGGGRTKRQAKVLEENWWDCSVCTYRNTAEAFKCLMCDVRKGTSTRKPRINPQLVAQQAAQQYPAGTAVPVAAAAGAPPRKERRRGGATSTAGSTRRRRHPPRLRNIDRSSAQTREVTVNSVTVVITEYKPKVPKSAEQLSTTSSSDHGSHSESSMDAR